MCWNILDTFAVPEFYAAVGVLANSNGRVGAKVQGLIPPILVDGDANKGKIGCWIVRWKIDYKTNYNGYTINCQAFKIFMPLLVSSPTATAEWVPKPNGSFHRSLLAGTPTRAKIARAEYFYASIISNYWLGYFFFYDKTIT